MLLTVCLLFFMRTVSPSCVLVAAPDYPVAAGQTVHLHCSSEPPSFATSFGWERVENQTWAAVSNGSDLTLTEADQSGLYRCSARNQTQASWSQNCTVFIVAIPSPAADGPLGVVAFVFSLLALASSGAALFWLGRQKRDIPLPTSNKAKDFPAPKTAPKVTVTQPDDEGDVYINYSSTNHAYTDLDPTRMAVSSVYSTLS